MSLNELLASAQSGIPLSERPWSNIEVNSISSPTGTISALTTSSVVTSSISIGDTKLASSALVPQTVTFGSKSTGAGDVVYTSGPQTIGGQKQFTLPVVAQSFVDRSNSGLPLRLRQESSGAAFQTSLELDYAGNATTSLGPGASDVVLYSTPSAQIQISDGTNKTNLDFPAPAGVISLGFPNASDSMLGSAAVQNVSNKTFTDSLVDTKTSNQIVLGTTQTTTIDATAPAASQTVTIPDSGAVSTSVILANSGTTQTIHSDVTVTSTTPTLAVSGSSGANLNVSGSGGGSNLNMTTNAGNANIISMSDGVNTGWSISQFGSGVGSLHFDDNQVGGHSIFVPVPASGNATFATDIAAQSLSNKTLAAPSYSGQSNTPFSWNPTGAGAATLNSASGYVAVTVITAPLAIGAQSGTFTVTNSFVTTDSIVLLQIANNSAFATTAFWIYVSATNNGNFTFYLQNGGAALLAGATFRVQMSVQ
jgi:hypothetical protein